MHAPAAGAMHVLNGDQPAGLHGRRSMCAGHDPVLPVELVPASGTVAMLGADDDPATVVVAVVAMLGVNMLVDNDATVSLRRSVVRIAAVFDVIGIFVRCVLSLLSAGVDFVSPVAPLSVPNAWRICPTSAYPPPLAKPICAFRS